VRFVVAYMWVEIAILRTAVQAKSDIIMRIFFMSIDHYTCSCAPLSNKDASIHDNSRYEMYLLVLP